MITPNSSSAALSSMDSTRVVVHTFPLYLSAGSEERTSPSLCRSLADSARRDVFGCFPLKESSLYPWGTLDRTNRRHRSNHDEPEFSNQSIMNTMEKFVRTVQEMDETILVPCRLMDLKVGDSSDQLASNEGCKSEVQAVMSHADLYSLYTMVNAVKNELLWGQNLQPSDEGSGAGLHSTAINGKNYAPSGIGALTSSHSLPSCTNYSNVPVVKTHSRNSSASNIKPEKQTPHQGHQRRPSTGSLVSTHSLTSMSLSDTDSEAGNENDSGIEDGSGVDPALQIALNFRKHLNGLHKSLYQLTQAARYLTQRYQHDVGGNV